MARQVYRFPPAARDRMEAALGDHILSHQSLHVREARHFGREGDWVYVFVEGSPEGIIRADALLLAIGEREPDAEALWARVDAEDDEAATSLGSVFDGF